MHTKCFFSQISVGFALTLSAFPLAAQAENAAAIGILWCHIGTVASEY
jgi:hypothetical protein